MLAKQNKTAFQAKTAMKKMVGKDLSREGARTPEGVRGTVQPDVAGINSRLGSERAGDIAVRLHQALEGRPTVGVRDGPLDTRSESSVASNPDKNPAGKKGKTDDRVEVLLRELIPLSHLQVQEVSDTYRKRIGMDLRHDIDEHTDGMLHDVLTAIVTPPHQLVAKTVKDTVDRVRTHGNILSEVICLSPPMRLRQADDYYREHENESMVEAVRSHTRAAFEQVLASVIIAASTGNIERGSRTAEIERDVQRLHESGAEKVGKHAETFVEILCSAGPEHRARLEEAYVRKYGKSLILVVKEQFSSDTERALLYLLRPTHEVLADMIHDSFKDTDTLARIIALHRDQLPRVNDWFLKMHGVSLSYFLNSKLSSGSGRDAMLSIVKMYE